MNYFNKKNIVIIIIVALLVINISTISTIIFLAYNKPTNIERPVERVRSERAYQYMKRELKLDTVQYKNFREMGLEFKSQSNEIVLELRLARQEMVELMSTQEPDIDELYRLSEYIGDLHEQLKKNTIDHFMKMKKQCSPDQFLRLGRMFKDLVMDDDLKNEQNRGRGQGRRGGRNDKGSQYNRER